MPDRRLPYLLREKELVWQGDRPGSWAYRIEHINDPALSYAALTTMLSGCAGMQARAGPGFFAAKAWADRNGR